MTTIAELLRQSSECLAAISSTPQLDAELLLACVLERSRTHLRAWPEAIPHPAQQERFRQLVERRRSGEPVAYLLGWREFWSHVFQVGPEVLIPRPETELLVEAALTLVPENQQATIADLGTGSGAIAISLGLERPRAQLIAIDLSAEVLGVAKSNAYRLGADNLAFVCGDWLTAFAPAGFDLIVSNPPYIAADDPHLKGDIRFEPAAALVGGGDGLAAFRRLIPQAHRCLKPGGWLLLEHSPAQQDAVAEMLRREGFKTIACQRDLEDRPRLTQAQRSG